VADGFDAERRRLAGMLPGAEIEPAGAEPAGVIALVRDLDAPIPVLVERGGYEYPLEADAGAGRSRRLRRGNLRLVLVDDRAEFARLVRA
jgi:hypothetical protein